MNNKTKTFDELILSIHDEIRIQQRSQEEKIRDDIMNMKLDFYLKHLSPFAKRYRA